MKKSFVTSLLVIMLAVSVVPALAAGNPQGNRGNGMAIHSGNQSGFGLPTPYALSGTIYAIDSTARSVTVTVACGNRMVSPSIGEEVTLNTTPGTRFLLRNTDGSVTPITFDDLGVGQNISSHGSLVSRVWTANRITAGALLNCLP